MKGTVFGEGKSVTELISITFLGRVLGRLFKYALVVLLARELGGGALGTFALGFAIIRFAGTIANFGLEPAMKKFVPIYRTRDDDGAISGLVVGAVVVSVVGGAVAVPAGRFLLTEYALFSGVAVGGVVSMLLLSVPFLATLRSLDAVTLGYDRTSFSVYIRDFGQEGVALLMVGAAVLFVGTEQSAAVGYVVAMAATTLLAFVLVYRLGGFDGVDSPSLDVRSILPYTAVTTLSSLSDLTIGWIDILVLSTFVARDIVGQYQAAYQTAALLTFALVASNSIFPSLASRLYEVGETERLGRLFRALVKWISLSTLVATISLILLRDEVLFIFGTSFQNAAETLVVLAIAQWIVATVGPAGYVLLMTGKERVELVGKVVISVLNVVLNFLLVPPFGILGAAVATAISLAILNVIRLAAVQSSLGFYSFRPNVTAFVSLVISTVAVVAGVKALHLPAIATLLVAGPLVMLVSSLVGYLVVYDESDRILLEAI
jgi:O-antigen/teichoic acid export membrane protein